MLEREQRFDKLAMFIVCMVHILLIFFMAKSRLRPIKQEPVTWIELAPLPMPSSQLSRSATSRKMGVLKPHRIRNDLRVLRDSQLRLNVDVAKDSKTFSPPLDEITASAKQVPETDSIDFPSDTIDSKMALLPDTLLGKSLQLAGKVDRELRKGKLERLSETRFQRFAKAVENAYIDRSTYERRSFMELPDGTTYYSFTKGGKTECFMTGSVNASGKGGSGAPITCPTSFAGWTQY